MSDLRTELTAIDGIGEATADKILGVIEPDNEPDPYIEKAKAAAAAGDDLEAAIYLRRATGAN